MEVAWHDRTGAGFDVVRWAPNEWHVHVGPPEVRIRLLLDECGSWLTMACADGQRPVVVRRAGWVDLRAQPGPVGSVALDRVGLGPGDSVVVVAGGCIRSDPLLDRLVTRTSGAADEMAAVVVDDLEGPAVLVLRVPEFADGVARAMAATGLPAEAFAEPLHPVGSPEAEIWDRRPTPPCEARMRLEPVTAAVPSARSLLRRLLASWRMPELLDGDVELLATELLTNAVLHAGTPMTVVIGYDGESVRFEVHDELPGAPEPEQPTLEAERGRGLWLVQHLSDGWGVAPTARGKAVWFELHAG
jgi:anti-sigma regulatory factor (Ser/Thr protein kinase)/microcompartment protein CcmK/EutM